MTDPMRQIDRSLIQEMEEASRAPGEPSLLEITTSSYPQYRVSRKGPSQTTRKQANPQKSRIPEWSNHWVLIVYYQATTLGHWLRWFGHVPLNKKLKTFQHVSPMMSACFQVFIVFFFFEGLYKIPPRLVNDDCFWRDWCGAPDVVCLSLCRFQMEL